MVSFKVLRFAVVLILAGSLCLRTFAERRCTYLKEMTISRYGDEDADFV